ncbi:MAG: sulfotransferase [Myxococcota bacterium]
MSWKAPARPDWVEGVNRGGGGPAWDAADLPLSADEWLRTAAAQRGVDIGTARRLDAAFGAPGFEAEFALAQLRRLGEALEHEARLHRVGRWLTRRFLLRLIEVRFQLMAALAQDPGIADEEVRAPVFVAGAPRTGTTILHRLLAADARHRVPLGWELLRPLPTPRSALVSTEEATEDARIGLAEVELSGPQSVVQDLRSIHTYAASRPKECLSAMSFAFQSEEFTARYAIPSYEAWLEASDMAPAYRMHRLVLQVLQRRQDRVRWVLKSPVHLHALPVLFGAYPDAKVAITHRNVPTLLASLTSLIATLRYAHSDSVDVAAIGTHHVDRYAATFERLVDATEAGALPEGQIHHSHHRAFIDDPIAVARELYGQFEISLPADVEAAMRAVVETKTDDHAGAHRYDRDLVGIAPDRLAARFVRYHEAFGLDTDTANPAQSPS